MRIVLILNRMRSLFRGDVSLFLDAARAAEQAGIDDIMMVDRIVIGPRWDSYPFGRVPYSEGEWFPEPLTMLAAIATATSTVRIGTGVVIAVARPAVILAKTAATLDRISAGRLDLGVGSGWQAEELEACGVPIPKRMQRLEDTIGACRALWTGQRVSFASSTVAFKDVMSLPTPQQERLPVWFGGPPTSAVMERIAKLGDGWIPIGNVPPSEIERGTALLSAAYRAVGRDPATAQVRAPAPIVRGPTGSVDVGTTIDSTIALLRDTGATQAYLGVGQSVATAEDVRPFIESLGRAWRGATTDNN
jgi:probable F420-dependent oxidoreductase